MFSEVVKLTPQVDRGALNTMMRNLSTRFGELTRKFGQGFKNALKFGGIAAIGAGLLTRLLNPLEKAEEVIDRILNKGDDAVTNAEEFGSTPGKLLRLEGLAAAKGLAPDALRLMLGKFQAALAKEQEKVALPERIQKQIAALPTDSADPQVSVQRTILETQLVQAKADKAGGGLLREFVGETDTADAFFKFVQSVQAIPDKSRQTVVQTEVFGEKVRGKASEFLNAKDFQGLLKDLPATATLDQAATKINDISDAKDRLAAIRALQDFVTKAKFVNLGQVEMQDKSARRDMSKENDILQNYAGIKAVDDSIEELLNKFEKTIRELTVEVVPEFIKGIKALTSYMPKTAELKKDVGAAADFVVEPIAAASVNVSEWLDSLGQPLDPNRPKMTPAELAATSAPSDADILKGLSTEMHSLGATLERIWGEFKSSSIYRNWFGGD